MQTRLQRAAYAMRRAATMSLFDVLFGRPIATKEDRAERVGVARGVAILGLDALASAAYGPEALLTVLIPLGAGALAHLLGVMVFIVPIKSATHTKRSS